MSDRLLDGIAYVSRKPYKMVDLNGNDVIVCDTFPFNPESKTSPETAKSWAKSRFWNDTSDVEEPIINLRKNDPFKVKILNLEFRSEGGRAYKVIDSDGRRFDLREDQLVEAMRFSGIDAGGQIRGDFVWGISGSQIKMVHIGGKLHTKMVNYVHQLETQKAVSLANLQVGSLYAKRHGYGDSLYLGKLTHPDLEGTHHAFLEVYVPEDPSYYNELGKRVELVYPAGLNALQKLEFYRKTEKHYSGGRYPDAIVIQKSPKFFEETVEDNDVTNIKANPADYRLVNGNGESLSEVIYERKNGKREKAWWHAHGAYEKQQISIQAEALSFAKNVVWK